MSEYKRLTIYDNGVAMALSADGKKEFSDSRYRHIIDRLAELEDKIESGKMIEFPFIVKTKKNKYYVVYIKHFVSTDSDFLRGYFCAEDFKTMETAEKRLAEIKAGKV